MNKAFVLITLKTICTSTSAIPLSFFLPFPLAHNPYQQHLLKKTYAYKRIKGYSQQSVMYYRPLYWNEQE